MSFGASRSKSRARSLERSRPRFRIGWLGLIVATLLLPSVADAGLRPAGASRETVSRAATHPISKMAGTFFVSRGRVSVRLRLYVEDLYLFHESVEPDEQDRLYADSLLPAAEAHKQFLLDKIRILDIDGRPIPGRVIDMTPLDIPAEGWGTDELMQHTIDYDLEFELASPPEFLTIVQDVVDENFVFPSELEMLLRQEGHDSVDAKILRPSEPYTARFVWDRPPLDADASREEFEQLLEQDREELLGITTYDAIYSFFYITRLEARHEILIPLATLATVVQIPHADPNQLTIAEQDPARELIRQYFLGGNPVMIDGVEVPPIVDRIDFYGLDLKDFAQRAEPRDVSLASGRVGVILRYPAKQEPSTVALTWTQFNSTIRKVTTVVFAMDETLKFEFSRFRTENTFAWTNPDPELSPRGVLPIPVGLPEPPRWSIWGAIAAVVLLIVAAGLRSMGLATAAAWICWATFGIAAGTAAVPEGWRTIPGASPAAIPVGDRQAVVRGLVGNVYRAFDYADEEPIYDALSQTAEGDLLTELYLEVRRGLTVQDQGGAVATVQKVEFVSLDAADGIELPGGIAAAESPGFVARGTWNVTGTIEHWGHIHQRVNQYDGVFVVKATDQGWRLSALELTDERRLENRRTLRRF
ncbi:MAG TPA: hypothetical protein DCQ98_04615 [Planctomycetaceae bacterium]|nr:hypothetical protein [Planctomycetaceae bacterium]HRF01658.1 hypothetical protein [Pirellulaceae bacterium]